MTRKHAHQLHERSRRIFLLVGLVGRRIIIAVARLWHQLQMRLSHQLETLALARWSALLLPLLAPAPTGLVRAHLPVQRLLSQARSLTAEHFVYERTYNELPIFDGDGRVRLTDIFRRRGLMP